MLNPFEKVVLAQMISEHPQFHGTVSSISDDLASQFAANWIFPDGIEFIHETHGCLCCMTNLDSLFKRTELIFDPPRRRRSNKPNRALLTKIRKSVASSGSEQDDVKTASDVSQSDTEKKSKKKTKNQGKLKTFKRKSKKPGRI